MLEEELKKHSSKKTKQSRGSDIAYRATVPAQPIAPVRQSQRLMSKSNNTTMTAAGMFRTNKGLNLLGVCYLNITCMRSVGFNMGLVCVEN